MYKQINENTYEIIIQNEQNQQFKIHIGGSDLYWTMLNYKENNEFIITTEEKLFSQLNDLFYSIEQNDNQYNKLLLENKFEWVSEARQPEISSKLIIIKKENQFSIKFVRNPLDIVGRFGNICAICFCLSGSRNQKIADNFSLMFHQYNKTNIQDEKILKL